MFDRVLNVLLKFPEKNRWGGLVLDAFYKQCIFSTAQLFNKLSLKCGLSVTYYISALTVTRYILYVVSMSTSSSVYVLFMWAIFHCHFDFQYN